MLKKLDAVPAESNERLEKAFFLPRAGECVERFAWFILSQAIEVLDTFFNHVRTQLLDGLCAALERTYTGGQLLCTHTFMRNYGVGTASAYIQNPASRGVVDGRRLITVRQRFFQRKRGHLPQRDVVVAERKVLR